MAVEPVQAVTKSAPRGVLVWQWPGLVAALSSAAVGGGLSTPAWVMNVGVDSGYRRTDLATHAAEVASDLDLPGRGVALFTAASVDRPSRSAADGVTVHATVGVSHPTWAAATGESASDTGSTAADPPPAGTVNVVIQLPVALDGGAAVNAVITATEAKTQALLEAGIDGTGTASDAVVVVWPQATATERFAGPRSLWGDRLARCVHAAVAAGLES